MLGDSADHLHSVIHVKKVPRPDSKRQQVGRLGQAEAQTKPGGSSDGIVGTAQQQ